MDPNQPLSAGPRAEGGGEPPGAQEAASPARERILRAIVSAVAEHGYRRTTIAHICAEAGISRTTFYEHFENKEDCFLAAYDDMDRRLQEFVLTSLEGVEGATARVRAGTEAFLRGLAAGADATRVAVVEVMAAGPRAREAYERSVYAFAPIIEDGRGLLEGADELPAELPRVIVSAVAAVVFREVVAGRAEELPQMLPDFVYLILVFFVGHERALAERAAIAKELGQGAGG